MMLKLPAVVPTYYRLTYVKNPIVNWVCCKPWSVQLGVSSNKTPLTLYRAISYDAVDHIIRVNGVQISLSCKPSKTGNN